jgi:hypothetical protein
MCFPRNWEFGSALSKFRNFGGGGVVWTPQTLPLVTPLVYSLYSDRFIDWSTDPQTGIFSEKSQCIFSGRCSPVETHKIHCYMERNLLANFAVNTFGIFAHKTQRSNVIVWEPQMFVVPQVLVTLYYVHAVLRTWQKYKYLPAEPLNNVCVQQANRIPALKKMLLHTKLATVCRIWEHCLFHLDQRLLKRCDQEFWLFLELHYF